MMSFRSLTCTLLTGAFAIAAGPQLLPAQKIVLENGMTLLLAEQRKLPLVSLNLVVRAGSVADPQGQEGLANLTASLLRRGTQGRSADQLSDLLDGSGATLNTQGGVDLSMIATEWMKADATKAVDLLADLVMTPSFPESEVKKLVAQRIDGVRSAKDNVQAVLRNYFGAQVFGKHPYGRPSGGDENSLAHLNREAVVAFHAANYVPANLTLAIVGDFDKAELLRHVKARFEGWKPKGQAPGIALPEPQPQVGRKLLLVDKPDATQTYFMIGNVGVARKHPDRIGLEVVNTLLGGRFTSRLNSALRIKSGLTYGANSAFAYRQVPGFFQLNSYTRNASTEKALDLALAVLKEFVEKGITEEELASAKAYYKGTLAPKLLETADQQAVLLAELAFFGLPESDINLITTKVDALTLAEANRLIRTHFPEQNLCFTLIGKAAEIESVARKYAPEVKVRSIKEVGF